MEEQVNPAVEETLEVVDVQFRPGQKVYYFDPAGEKFLPGEHVIMDTARGIEFGICAGENHTIKASEAVAPLRKILRHANEQDEKINTENRAKERRAYEVCVQKISSHSLDMQLVSAECAFDGSKILFYFTADERVDFRELVKDLASVFHTRIELRQIGVRDKAKMVGGLGICGRPFCCASFLDDFQPVSIKMAKTQSLSLNPTKISGTCGRLMCCLKYEQDTYESLIRSSPRPDSFVDTPEGRGTVVGVDILRQRVKVQMESNPETVSSFANEEIAVLRSGKARKNDAPIPADLAPVSGNGKQVRKKEEESAPVLEAIRFRYSDESIADEQSVQKKEQPADQTDAPAKLTREAERRPRRERPRRPRPENAGDRAQTKPEQAKSKNVQEAGEKSAADTPREGRQQSAAPGRPKRGPRPQRRSAPQSTASPDQSGQAAQEAAANGAAPAENRKPRRNNNFRRRKPKAPQSSGTGESGEH
jgi:cell fate regulator YaaT (PSP1 superfamily)